MRFGPSFARKIEHLKHVCRNERVKPLLVLDFDHTMTLCRKPSGQEGNSLQGQEHILEWLKNQSTSPSLIDGSIKLLNRVENPPSDPEELREVTEEWWRRSHSLIVSAVLTQPQIVDIMKQADLAMRPGWQQLFTIPNTDLIVVSAGLTDVIQAACAHDSLDIRSLNHVGIISNFMVYDGDVCVEVGPEEPIHWLNKPQIVHQQLKQRVTDLQSDGSRVIGFTLGDSIKDCLMLDGALEQDEILKIGFAPLKKGQVPSEQDMANHLALYDVVMEPEANMDQAALLIRDVLGI